MEMLVVLVIIGLVASLVGPQLLGRVDSSKITAAETQIRLLKGALDTLRLDIGRYPKTEEGLSMLTIPPNDERLRRKWQGPYLTEATPSDPWGNNYLYKEGGPNAVILFSYGADGKLGGEGINADVGFIESNNQKR